MLLIVFICGREHMHRKRRSARKRRKRECETHCAPSAARSFAAFDFGFGVRERTISCLGASVSTVGNRQSDARDVGARNGLLFRGSARCAFRLPRKKVGHGERGGSARTALRRIFFVFLHAETTEHRKRQLVGRSLGVSFQMEVRRNGAVLPSMGFFLHAAIVSQSPQRPDAAPQSLRRACISRCFSTEANAGTPFRSPS